MKSHNYSASIIWTGNTGSGTANYRNYERSHTIQVAGKPTIDASSDPNFRGDANKYNPEELFLASLSSCHMLWFLHLCSVEGVIVLEYSDQATGTMHEEPDGSGRFTEVTLHPKVMVVQERMAAQLASIHAEAHKKCFLANSCNFPVKHQPTAISKQD